VSKLYEKIIHEFDDAVYFVDAKRKITFWNHAAEEITGYKAKDVIGTYCYDNLLKHIDDCGNKLCHDGCPLHATLEDRNKRETKVYLHHKEGHRVEVFVKTVVIEDSEDNLIGSAEIFSTVNKQFYNMEIIENLKEIAYRDQLTGLYNRHYLEKYIKIMLEEFHLLNKPFSVLFMDIDNFKIFNDTYGHDLGDDVLKLVARTIENSTRETDIAIRYGGEELIVLCGNLGKDNLEKFAEKIRVLISNSYIEYEGEKLSVTVSIGAATVRDTDTVADIIKRSDELMYQSKNNGKNTVTV